MASGKNFRQEKRVSTFPVIGTAVVFVALCLFGVWVFSSSSESQSSVGNEFEVEVEAKPEIKGSSDIIESNDTFEESAGDPTVESEEKLEESPKNEADEAPKPAKILKHANEEEVSVDLDPEETKYAKVPKEEESEGLESEAESKTVSQTDEEELIIKDIDTSESQENDADTGRSEKKKKKPKETSVYGSEESSVDDVEESSRKTSSKQVTEWSLCDTSAGVDYIPCLDNTEALKALRSTKHYEHRERHCPDPAPECLVPLPEGYRTPVSWPLSRNEVWYKNVPHTGLVSYKKDQQWVKRSNDRLIFPGGGTQFKHGALHYIDYVEEQFPKIGWGKRSRVVLDVGCGVASFGGYMFDRDVLTMSFAPKDEHEAQVQFALERGIPAISSVMGTQRLVFPSNVYDVVHCARCRVPWHIEGGKLLLELNRVLRPGGYFVWSATPVYWNDEENVQIWKDTRAMTTAMCWKLVAKFVDPSTGIGAAIFRKPTSNSCYEKREKDFPPMCEDDDSPDAAWYTPMTACLHKIPVESDARGTSWPSKWPQRLSEVPAWLAAGPKGADFQSDTERWERIVKKSYLQGLGIDWQNVRNVMDMRAVYGGFAAALASQPVWVMNVVPVDASNTLPVIFDRGLFGIYHDWCESFSSYPRTYDLLHADHIFSRLKKRCTLKAVIAETDRLLRPEGWLIVRESVDVMSEVRAILESLHWNVRMAFSKSTEAVIAVQKSDWRPESTIF